MAKTHRMPQVAGHFFAKEPLIIGLFCGKWTITTRPPMCLRHPVVIKPQMGHMNRYDASIPALEKKTQTNLLSWRSVHWHWRLVHLYIRRQIQLNSKTWVHVCIWSVVFIFGGKKQSKIWAHMCVWSFCAHIVLSGEKVQSKIWVHMYIWSIVFTRTVSKRVYMQLYLNLWIHM